MTQEILFLIVLAFTGVFSSRWMLRLAPWTSELPLKTIVMTALCGGLALMSFQTSVPRSWLLFALIAGSVYIFAPLVFAALARAKRYKLANSLVTSLYWTPAGRQGLNQLLAQVALQQGDAEMALALAKDSPNEMLVNFQAYSLQSRWHDVLDLPMLRGGDNVFLAMSARARAFLELGQISEAEYELRDMETTWHEQGEGPIGYRTVTLTKARIQAFRGNFEAVRSILSQPLPGLSAHLLYEVMALAAEKSERLEPATQFYAQAYVTAPESQRPKFAEKLEAYGQELPEIPRPQRSYATMGLTIAIIAAYAVQAWLQNNYGPNAGGVTAGFLLNVQVPEADALWRYLSYGFVHGGLVHIGMNSWVLFDVGRLYESRRPWGNILAAFVVGTIVGAYLTSIAQANVQLVLVGASGGVLGVAGALLADTWRGTSPKDRQMTRSLLQWMGFIVIFSLAIPGVSLWGHVGGVIGGLLWGFIRQGLPSDKRIDMVAAGISIILMVYVLVMAGQWFLRYV